MHDCEARDNRRYLKLVCALVVCFVRWKRGSGKNGEKARGERETKTGVEESTKERHRLCMCVSVSVCVCVCVCVPGYQEQRDARSQTYEEAIVHEHFAPVTSARQWPPLTRPVTVSLFADNAWKYAETHAGYPWSVDSRFPLIRALSDRTEKTRGTFSGKSSSLSVTRKSHRVLPYPRVFRGFNEQEDRAIESIQRPLSAFPPFSRNVQRGQLLWQNGKIAFLLCYNVYPARSWERLKANLKTFFNSVF